MAIGRKLELVVVLELTTDTAGAIPTARTISFLSHGF
jgi:hypothetical protein